MDTELDLLVKQITIFIDEKRGSISTDYKWPPPKDLPNGFSLEGPDVFTQTCELKKALREEINANTIRKKELLTWWVKKWGGIKKISDDKLEKFSSLPNLDLVTWLQEREFKNISSWSKIAALMHPDSCAIYDARVAFSINTLNFLMLGGVAPIFPMPNSQNSLIKFLDIETLLRIAKHYDLGNRLPDITMVKNSIQISDVVPKEMAYKTYMDLIHKVCQSLGLNSCDIPEMVLFAHAGNLAKNLWYACAGAKLQLMVEPYSNGITAV